MKQVVCIFQIGRMVTLVFGVLTLLILKEHIQTSLKEILVATREESGVFSFPSRRGLTPRVSLICEPEIPVASGEKHSASTRNEALFHCAIPSGVPRGPSQLHSIPDFSEAPSEALCGHWHKSSEPRVSCCILRKTSRVPLYRVLRPDTLP